MDTVHNPDKIPVEARAIPSTLLDTIQMSLEEGLYVRAIDTLSAVTFHGLSNPKLKGSNKATDGNARRLIYIPGPDYLAIVTTLALHPDMTSKKRSRKEHPEVAERALRYISNLVRMVGPDAARLQDAWRFRAATTPTRTAARKAGNGGGGRGGRRKLRNRSPSPENNAYDGGKGRRKSFGEDKFAPFAFLKEAHEESAFARCDDGWGFVGWAFVCSVEYPRRWAHYGRFLKLVLDALRADWEMRCEAAEKGHRVDAKAHECLAKAMGFLPKESQTMGSAFYKRLARAIFADGSERSLKDWMPAFEYEITKRPKKGRAFEMFKHLDPDHPTGLRSSYDDGASSSQPLDIKEIGDDKQSESDADEQPRSQWTDLRMANNDNIESKNSGERDSLGSEGETISGFDGNFVEKFDLTLDWGGIESIVLRQKFMCLICDMHQYDLNSLQILYDEFSYTIKHLSIEEMMLFVTTVPPCSKKLTYRFRSSLWQFMLRSMIGKQQADVDYIGDLSDEVFTNEYLPAVATKPDVEWNAKVAVLVEALARLWLTFSKGKATFIWTEKLQVAAEKGIKAREKKVEEKGPVRKNTEELKKMELSHDRLRILIQLSKRLGSSS